MHIAVDSGSIMIDTFHFFFFKVALIQDSLWLQQEDLCWWEHIDTLSNVSSRVLGSCSPSGADFDFLSLTAIEVGADMPSEAVIDKWLGEPIKAAILPTSIFLTNKKGFPVLSKAHQRIIFNLFKVLGNALLVLWNC